jgi:hypothetical protein
MLYVRRFSSISIGITILVGCQSQRQILVNDEEKAIDTAVRRGQFELNCPEANGEVLSSNMLQPALWRGEERAEYTVGVSGCGKRSVYVVICPLGSPNCFAGAARGNPGISQ